MIKSGYKKPKKSYGILRDATRKIYFKTDSLWILNGDFLKTDRIKEGMVELIITSPPYNVDIKYKSYDDKIPYNEGKINQFQFNFKKVKAYA